MKPWPLRDLGLNLYSHSSALWWLVLLYRRPRLFDDSAADLSRLANVRTGAILYLHAYPYLLVLGGLGRWLSQKVFEATDAQGVGYEMGLLIAGLTGGLLSCAALSWAVGRTTLALAYGLTLGLALGAGSGHLADLAYDPFSNLAFGFSAGAAYGIVAGLSETLSSRIGSGLGLGMGFGLAEGLILNPMAGLLLFLGFSLGTLRLFYHPLHMLWMWPRVRGKWYPWHPAAWDDGCTLPFPSLTRLLLDYAVASPDLALSEIERLIAESPAQRRAALHAQCILIARRAAGTRDLALLGQVIALLPEEDVERSLAGLEELRQDVQEIAGHQANLNTQHRPFLREVYASLLVKSLESFATTLAVLPRPLAVEFQVAADNWLELARNQLEDARDRLSREPVPQIFHAGKAVDRNTAAFVPRTQVIDELESLLLQGPSDSPALILYGRRRTGKSTLLRNLESFLPTTIRVANCSMLSARAVTSLDELIRLLFDTVSQCMAASRQHPWQGASDLVAFEAGLAALNAELEHADLRLLLALDEYENLDRKIGDGVLPEDLLGSIRISIQSHPRIVWMFAGSHALDELEHAPWTSYLVEASTIEVPLFSADESRLLLTEPLRSSELFRDGAVQPRFEPGFWGEGGIERLHAETVGWPHLLQLAARTIVDLINQEGRRQADGSLLERAFEIAVRRGDAVFHEILRHESRLPGEWEYLLGFRDHDSQQPPSEAVIARSLRRRLMVEIDAAGAWRLKAPLFARWLQAHF